RRIPPVRPYRRIQTPGTFRIFKIGTVSKHRVLVASSVECIEHGECADRVKMKRCIVSCPETSRSPSKKNWLLAGAFANPIDHSSNVAYRFIGTHQRCVILGWFIHCRRTRRLPISTNIHYVNGKPALGKISSQRSTGHSKIKRRNPRHACSVNEKDRPN